MNTSQRGLNLIKRFEGFSPHAYLCPGNVWTIGYGSTRGVQSGDTITKERAEELLKIDVEVAEADVKRHITAPLTQNQFDALVSFVYNVGATGVNPKTSTLSRMINSGDIEGAATQFQRWVFSNGVRLKGLIRRRNAEMNLFIENMEPQAPTKVVDQPSKPLRKSKTVTGAAISAGAGGMSVANGMLLNDTATVATDAANTIGSLAQHEAAFTFMGLDVKTLVIIAGILGILGGALALYARWRDKKEGRL